MLKPTFVFCALLLLISCGEASKGSSKDNKITTGDFIFKLQAFYPALERNFSFPVMFNDSVIKTHKIKSVTRKLMSTVDVNEQEMLKEVEIYYFNKEGNISGFELKSFYEGLLYHDIYVEYLEEIGPQGFRQFKVVRETDFKEIGLDRDDIVTNLELINYDTSKLVIHNMTKNRNEYYALLDNCWNPVSIDTMFNPTSKDIIYFGTPNKPFKKYQVETLVKENDVLKFNYNGDHLISISHDNYPFQHRRNITYDSNGGCKGFIDSTFSENVYLNRKVYTYQFINEIIPVALLQTMEKGKAAKVESYEYEYYTEHE